MEDSYNLTEEELALIEAQIREFLRNHAMQEQQMKTAIGHEIMDTTPSMNSYLQLELSINWRIALMGAFSLNIALSTIGNIIVLIVLLFSKTPKTELNLFLINLALADLTMAIFCMPFTFSTIMYGYWIFSTAMCPTVIFFQQVSVMVSVYTLIAIGIDRYFAVLYPLKVRVTKNRAKVWFTIIWLISTLLAIVQTVFARARKVLYEKKMFYFCTEWWPYDSAAIFYELFMVMVTYFIPVIVLLFCYVRVGRRLWGRRMPGNADRQRDESFSSSKKKVIKMLILVVVLFVLCWLPLHVFMLVTRFAPYMYSEIYHQDLMRKINSVVLWIAMSNSFMNPLVYSFLNDGFRADVKALIGHVCRRARAGQIQRRDKRHRSLLSSTVSSSFLSTKTLQITDIDNRLDSLRTKQVHVLSIER